MKDNALHKFQLQRLLIEIVDNPILSQELYFKGGTCASMQGMLDRFSVDLDFDKKEGSDSLIIRKELKKVFNNLDLVDHNKNEKTLFFELKYDALERQRNTIKLAVYEDFVKSNDYTCAFLQEIDRLINCQTRETMFANILVVPIDRFNKHGTIAARDIYDIYYFFLQGYTFKKEIIEERMKIDLQSYILMLIDFIETEINETNISQDLNALLPNDKFQKIRKSLKKDVLLFLRNLKTA